MSASLPQSNIRDQMRHVLASPGPDRAGSARRVAPPLEAAVPADALLEPWFSCLQGRLGPTRIFDCHTHLGCADPDGSCFGVDELLGALAVVDRRAVVFPLAESDSYRAANDRMLAVARAAEGRLVAFCRVDPHDGDAVREVERALGRGAAVKLHPRAERFGLDDPAVRRILAVANERRLPVIVHAGRGIPSLGRDALELARAFPRAPLILAHAAIADLAWIWREASGQRNLFFDTAWWNTADQLALFALIPPGQILFASDTPYGRTIAAASVVLRGALAAGLSAAQIAMVAGGQLERLLAGAEPLDLGPAPAAPAPSPGPLLERVHALLVAATAAALGALLLDSLNTLRHSDGSPAPTICGPRTWDRRGATIAFNFLHPDGRVVDERCVDRVAGGHNISLRTGCFCNPGAGEVAFTISRETLVGGEFGEGMTLEGYIRQIGLPSGGAIRASLGLVSNFADLQRFMEFASEFVDLTDVPPDLPPRIAC